MFIIISRCLCRRESSSDSDQQLDDIERAAAAPPRLSKPIYNTYGDAASLPKHPNGKATLAPVYRDEFPLPDNCRRGKNDDSFYRIAKGANSTYSIYNWNLRWIRHLTCNEWLQFLLITPRYFPPLFLFPRLGFPFELNVFV